MSTQNFAPTVWRGMIQKNLDKNHKFKQAVISSGADIAEFGTKVKINAIGRPTLSEYERNVDIADIEAIVDASQMLDIDQGKVFNIGIDNVDKRQANAALMQEWSKQASYQFAQAGDVFLAGIMAAGAGTTLTPVTIGTASDDDDAYAAVKEMQVVLDENDVPEEDRHLFAPPWFTAMLENDPRVSSFGTPANREVYRGQPIVEVAGFMIRKTNNAPDGTNVIACWKGATAYEEQMLDIEAYKPEKRFGDALKGLHVSGGKVIEPIGIAKLVATQGSF